MYCRLVWADREINFASIEIPCRACLGVCHYADKHKLKQQMREREREREGEGAHKAGFLLPRTPLSPREHTFNYRRDKEDMREFKYDESVIPPPQMEIALSPHSML